MDEAERSRARRWWSRCDGGDRTRSGAAASCPTGGHRGAPWSAWRVERLATIQVCCEDNEESGVGDGKALDGDVEGRRIRESRVEETAIYELGEDTTPSDCNETKLEDVDNSQNSEVSGKRGERGSLDPQADHEPRRQADARRNGAGSWIRLPRKEGCREYKWLSSIEEDGTVGCSGTSRQMHVDGRH